MMLRRYLARKLRTIAERLDPQPVPMFNRRKDDSVRSPEERLESLKQMAEARNLMQMFETQAALVMHQQQNPRHT